jgi:hypothetical protein
VIVTGDKNRVEAKIAVTWRRDELPAPAQVDIGAELAVLKEALASIEGARKPLVENAVTEAEHLAKEPDPPKDKIGAALERAVGYAGDAEKLAASGEKLWPALKAIGGWLGTFGPAVLKLAGISVI